MPQALVTLPDGKKARITFTDEAQLNQTVSDLSEQHAVKFGHYDRATHTVRGVGDVAEEAIGEPALKMLSGMAGSAVGGAEGLVKGLGAGAASLAQGEGFERARNAFTDVATENIEKRSEQMTVQPRSQIGKGASQVAEYPFTLIAKGGDKAGQVVADVTHSPALGAAVNTVTQSVPAMVLGGAAKALGRGAAAEELSASGAARSPPFEVPGGSVPRETAPPPQTQGEAPGAAQAPGVQKGTPDTNEARAKAYGERIGLDWARLGAGTRKALATIAQDSRALERLNPEAVRRQAHLESLRIPVKATRGQLDRDTVQLRREAIASNTTEGQPIRDTDIAANRDLQANLEVLRGRVGGKRGGLHEPVTEEGVPAATPSIREATKLPSQVGEAAQQAAREKAKWSKKGYDALYKIARETEPTARAGLKPVTDLLTENPDIQHLGWVSSWLNKAAKSKAPAGGEPVAMTDVTLNELDDLRQLANKNIKAGGTAGHYAQQLKGAIDTAMQDVPQGAAAWKRATAAFRKHSQEFKDQGIVQKLVSNKKGGADRALALEQTWKELATGTLEPLRQAKRTLMTGGTPATRMAGRRAWRDIRAETVNRILEDARNVTAADETERAILTEAALRRSINRIPRENLEEILGKANVRELMNILRARRITTRSPVGGRTTQSGTVPNMLNMAEKILKHIPGVKFVVGAKHALADISERGAAARAAQDAPITPLEQAVRDVEGAAQARARRTQFQTLEQSGPTLPASESEALPIGAAMKRPNQ